MAEQHYTASQASLWIQGQGPNSPVAYLGCHEIDDVSEEGGDSENIYCPDPSGPNKYRVVGTIESGATTVSTSIVTDVTDVRDYLERVRGKFTLFVNKVAAGRLDVFTNAERVFILRNASITSKTLSDLAKRTPDDNARSTQSFDISAEEILRYFDLTMTRQGIAGTDAINGITFCNEPRDRTDELPALDVAQIGFAATDGNAVLKTTNGSTWTATTAAPFTSSDVVQAVTCFEMGRDQTRVVVALGTTKVAAPPKIAYSDDSGATWTSVEVNATNAEFIPTPHALFAIDRNNMWVGLDSGKIYYSADGGVSWTAQSTTAIAATDVRCIHFADAEVGWYCTDAGVVARTIDGGLSWAAVTVPENVQLNVIRAFDRNRAWVGTNGGKVWYTLDGGVTWTQRSFLGSGTGAINDIKFLNDLVGYIVRTASNVSSVLTTIDGGYSWRPMTTVTNAGINVAYVADLYNVIFAGEPQGGTGFIAKATN